MLAIVMKLHLGGVETGLAIDKVTDSGVFDYHFGPERIAWETEEICTVGSSNFNNNISPAGKDMLGVLDGLVWKSLGDYLI